MKGAFIKLLCIAGAGILGALLFGDAVAGVVVAPFGWIIGRAVELGAEAKEVGVGGNEVMEVMSMNRDEDDFLERMREQTHRWIAHPTYSAYLHNLFNEKNQFGPDC